MAKVYNSGLGISTVTETTSSGDELAKASSYIIPENVSYGDGTWKNLPISETIDELLRYEDFPTLSSPSITITSPSGTTHYIYDSTNTVLIQGTASENNEADFSLAYALIGVTSADGDISKSENWSFTTPFLNFGDTVVRATITSVKGPINYDSVIISRTPTLSPVVTITTETSATTATEITIEGTVTDPNNLNIETVTYEQSGAKTDSGTATGTNIWSFTETLSSGDNRFDVTAVNSYSLEGSDYLIVNQYVPETGGIQTLNPDSDIWADDGDYLRSNGGIAHYEHVNDFNVSPDSDYLTPQYYGAYYHANVEDPTLGTTITDIKVKFRARTENAPTTGKIRFRIRDGGSTIGNLDFETDGTGNWASYEDTISGLSKTPAELADLNFLIINDHVMGGNSEFSISAVQIEVTYE